MARSAAAGAYQNVCINLAGLTDKTIAAALLQRADEAWETVRTLHARAEQATLAKLRATAG